jgi:hypothetical protein
MRSFAFAFAFVGILGCSGAEDIPLPEAGTDGKAPGKDGAADVGSDVVVGKDFPSSPGDIQCGNLTCLTQSFACCMTRNGTMTMVSCTDPGNCPVGPMSVEIGCNEAAGDCPMGSVCCRDMSGALTSCQATCTGTQICTKNAECLMGACQTFTCPVIGTVHACAKPPGCM